MLNGVVIHGEAIGRTRGYPTANLQLSKRPNLADGVYAAWGYVHNKKYAAALIVGNDAKRIEVYLIDYSGEELYGTHMRVAPVERVSSKERLTETDLMVKMDGMWPLFEKYYV